MAIATQQHHAVSRLSKKAGSPFPGVGPSPEFRDRTLAQRVVSGISRRATYWSGRLRGRPRFDHAERSLHWLLSRGAQTFDGQSTPPLARVTGDLIHQTVEVLGSYGQPKAARRWSSRLNGLRQRGKSFAHCGRVAAPREFARKNRWSRTCSLLLAQDAVRMYQRGERAAADYILHQLRRRQHDDGSFGVVRSGDTISAHELQLRTVVCFLKAAQQQVAVTFSSGFDPVYLEIERGDARAKAVRDWITTLGSPRHVADIGCGSGRYLRLIASLSGPTNLTGIEASSGSLAKLPECVDGRRGELLRIPASDGEFDAAFAVESLEHSLVPRTAIDELCRIVRPGGRVLVIDKHALRQPLSEHAPWERWFRADEICRWLAPHCDEVSVVPLFQNSSRERQGTFLAWYGRRRPTD